MRVADPEFVVMTELIVIGRYSVGVIGTVNEDAVKAAPVRLAVVVVIVGAVETVKFEVYLHVV